MPSRKPKSKTAPTSNPSFRGFLNLNLSDEDKAIIKSAKYDESTYASDLEKWIDSGYKFTFSYDDYSHCFMVVATPQAKDHVDYGILMSGRGSTPIKALKQWVYMQTRLVGDADWTELLKAPTSFEIDD